MNAGFLQPLCEGIQEGKESYWGVTIRRIGALEVSEGQLKLDKHPPERVTAGLGSDELQIALASIGQCNVASGAWLPDLLHSVSVSLATG